MGFVPAVVTPLALWPSCHLNILQPVNDLSPICCQVSPPADSRGKSVWIALLSSSRAPDSTNRLKQKLFPRKISFKRKQVDSTFLNASLCLWRRWANVSGLGLGLKLRESRLKDEKSELLQDNHLSPQSRLDEAGLDDRALNSSESRLDPPHDSKAPWNLSSILRRSSSSSIASSSRGLRCWSTCAKVSTPHLKFRFKICDKQYLFVLSSSNVVQFDLRLVILLVLNRRPAVGLNNWGEAREAVG